MCRRAAGHSIDTTIKILALVRGLPLDHQVFGFCKESFSLLRIHRLSLLIRSAPALSITSDYRKTISLPRGCRHDARPAETLSISHDLSCRVRLPRRWRRLPHKDERLRWPLRRYPVSVRLQ